MKEKDLFDMEREKRTDLMAAGGESILNEKRALCGCAVFE